MANCLNSRKTNKISKSRVTELLKQDQPNLILHMTGLKCAIDANPEVFDEEKLDDLRFKVDTIVRDIWIDKTYVCFKGNRWKDSFIVEDKWYDLIRLILKTDFGRKAGKKTSEVMRSSYLAIAIVYIGQMLLKYGYDLDDIDISFKKSSKLTVEYLEDSRKDWNL